MIRCSVWGSGSPGVRVTMSAIPNGAYKVSLYTWEDNASATFSLALNGATVASGIVSGPAGTWKRLGPYDVNITNGTLAITSSGGADQPVGPRRRAGRRERQPAPDRDEPRQPDQHARCSDRAADRRRERSRCRPDADVSRRRGSPPGSASRHPPASSPVPRPRRASSNVTSAPPTTVHPRRPEPPRSPGRSPTRRPAAFSIVPSTSMAPPSPPTASTSKGAPAPRTSRRVRSRFCNQSVTLVPAVDAAKATMLRCSVYGPTGVQVTFSSVQPGTYDVSVYVWEDSNSVTFSLNLNGATVASNARLRHRGHLEAPRPVPGHRHQCRNDRVDE